MQRMLLHKKLYQVARIDETEYSPKVYVRLEKIKLFHKLKEEGCSAKTTCEALKVPQSTIYRWKNNYEKHGLAGLESQSKRPRKIRQAQWKPHVIQRILSLRKLNPLYGKYKIGVLLKRDYNIVLSVSTVGRIIQYLIKRKQIEPVSFYYAKKRARPRVFNNHAQRWKRGMKAKNPGDMFQIDHMSVMLMAGVQVKHFQGICPVTKMVVEQVYSRATSNIAKQFLEFAQASLPFKIQSIQVDGGSEFRKDFEQLCSDLHLPLYVLPPKSPEYNGNVERANGAAKYEFYAFYSGSCDLSHVRKELRVYVKKYNTYRPHQALHYLTPQQYYLQLTEA